LKAFRLALARKMFELGLWKLGRYVLRDGDVLFLDAGAWVLPTPGSRPHDPLATLDGSIWYTGQMANVLGRIDPTSGHIAGKLGAKRLRRELASFRFGDCHATY
jgi:hypothetical protein